MKSILLSILSFLLFDCNQESTKIIKIAGNAQGTTYQITWLSENKSNFKQAVDSILQRIDQSLSTYVPTSIISRINKNDTGVFVDDYFIQVFNKAVEISEKTNGLFDVTVAPVINAWGFGFTKKATVDSIMIDSLLDYIGYKMVRLEGKELVKEKPQLMLDFNALAQGYTVDVLAAYFESKSITNYLVELGGEVKAKGEKSKNEDWKIGIDQPNEIATDGRPLKAIIRLKNRALATSGNYRKFYVVDGKKFSHIIDPHTGYPAKHNLLSATVLANDCMTADAYATAFMVMGLEKSKQFLSEHKELDMEVFFIYDENGDWKTYTSETLKEWIEEIT
ncbi:MAG: FAD:protein FMN transferase [Chitinophagaceae bacterium]|nr:FAD:protein FMN transferase [Chitinophagaceae bacterium]